MNKKITYIAGSTVLAAAIVALPIAATSYAATSTSTINGTVNSTITVNSSGPVEINTAPTSTAVTSSARDTVNVSTNDPDGYSLTLATTTADRTLSNGTDTIQPSSGDIATPTTLTANHWGFRVDGLSGFSGTTTAETNVSTSSFNWAGVPAAGGDVTIKQTNDVASGDSTDVWYAMSVDTSMPSGTYSNTVVYTATARP